MVRLEQEEFKKIQLEILEYVASFCEMNDIHYFLDSGTLLGAVRHKGYIPWDDDIDIGMLREDYEKFRKIFNEKNTNSKYKFKTYEDDHSFYYALGKVIDTETVLFEPDELGIKLAVNIDIFPYDNAPDSDKEIDRMYNTRDKYQKWNNIRYFVKSPSKLKEMVKFMIFLFIPKGYFIKQMIKNAKKYMNSETEYIGNFCSYSRFKVNKRVFRDFIDLEFEGKKYKAPIGYDEWLRACYGDYMKLPPENKRVSHHKFIAYKKDDK